MNPKRGEYARNDEPTVQIAVRLPESLVARMDAERGSRSRASWLVEQLDPIAVAPRPAASVYDGATTNTAAASVPGCKHARKVRGASGLLRCQDCGALQR